jgi:trypsin-like peptidase
MITRTVEPANAIMPVLLIDARRDRIKQIVGTAFFFSPKPIILSVAHVLGVEPGDGECLAVPKRDAPDPKPGVVKYYDVMAQITNVRKHPQHDLAVANVPGVTRFEYFSLCAADPPAGATLLTYDLASRITFEASSGSEPIRTITPYVWKGYVHAVLDSQEIGMASPAKILEVSIPVVLGMSGAPVVEERTLNVAGIVFGNIARAVVPSPPTTESEARQWYLPVGQALHWTHAKEFLDSLGIS